MRSIVGVIAGWSFFVVGAVVGAQEREGASRSDLAAFLPGEALAYVELRHPGAHLARIVELAGLTRRDDTPQVFFVSPRLLEALKTVAGAALAITDFDARHGLPKGLLIIDPGSADLVYGLIETALSGASAAGELRAAEAIEGFPCYETPIATVALTERWILAGSSRDLIAATLERLKRPAGAASPIDPGLREARSGDGDELVSIHIDARRALARLKAEAFRGGEPPQEYRIAQAIADIESLHWAALRLGTSEKSLMADLELRLDQSNHAFAYHFLRTPQVSEGALRSVPPDAVAFLAFALGDNTTKRAASDAARAAEPVTGLDFGREIFANVNDAALFVLPWIEGATESRRDPIPDLALALTVKDAARSEALWKQLLSLAADALGSRVEPVRRETVEGHEVQVYAIDQWLELRFARLDDRVVIATSSAATVKAIAAAQGKGSALDDAELRTAVREAGPSLNKLLIVHAGRLWQMLRPMVHTGDREAEALEAACAGATLRVSSTESPTGLRLSFSASVPRIDEALRLLLQRPTASAPK